MTLLALARIVACTVALLVGSGAGLTLLLVSDASARGALAIAPFVGLAVTTAVAYPASSLGLPATRSIWILGAVALLLLGLGLRARPAVLRVPRGAAGAIVLAALPALVLAVWPMLAIDRLLPVGDSNCDPVSYASVTELLRNGSMRRPPTIKRGYPTRVSVDGMIKNQERVGFEMVAAYTDVLAGEGSAHRSLSAVAGVGFALGAAATGVFAAEGLGGGLPAGVAAALAYALCAFPLWIVYGGYAPQALGSGLLPLSLWVGSRAVRDGAWRDQALCGVLLAATAAVYSESLPYAVAPLVLLGIAEAWRCRTLAGARRALAVLLVIGAAAVACNPVAAARGLHRVYFVAVTPNRGNVDWRTDLRQVAGLLPVKPLAPGTSEILWLPFALLSGLAAIGWARLERGGRRLVLVFALPALLSIAWFVAQDFAYGEFKAWSIVVFLPFALLGVGLAASWRWSRGRRAARLAVVVGALAALSPVALQSVWQARAMATRFAFSPALDEVSGWLGRIGRHEKVFVSPGKLSSVTVYWIAYVLRKRPMRADVGICYTPFGKDRYAGEPWLLRHRSSNLRLDDALAARVVVANEEFELLRMR